LAVGFKMLVNIDFARSTAGSLLLTPTASASVKGMGGAPTETASPPLCAVGSEGAAPPNAKASTKPPPKRTVLFDSSNGTRGGYVTVVPLG